MRIVFCLALALFGVKAVGAYGFAVALAPLVGVVFVLRRGQLHTDPGPEADWAEVTPNLGWLLVGSVMAACLVNAGPISVNLLAKSSDSALVTRFAYGVIVARVPLFLFQAVQAALLPRLSRLATTGEMTEFRRGFGRLMAVVLAVGVIGTMAAYTLGPFVINKLYGAPLTRRTLTMLALGSVCYMVALAAAQAVIALHGHALVALGWTVGMVVFVVITAALGGEVFRRVEIALLAGSAASMLTFLIALRSRLHSGAIVDQASLMDAVTDWPVEA
jgi:O-antigen/teichoic acid export membrane protein